MHASTSNIASTSSTDSVPAMPTAADATLITMDATARSWLLGCVGDELLAHHTVQGQCSPHAAEPVSLTAAAAVAGCSC